MKLLIIDEILSNYSKSQFYNLDFNSKHRNDILNEYFNHWKINFEWVSISEIDDFKNVIYPICNINNIDPMGIDIFDDVLKNYIEKGLKVCYFHLPEYYPKDQIENFTYYLKNNNINEKNIFLFVNNYKQQKYLNELKSILNSYTPYFLLQVHSKMLQKNKVEFLDDKKFLFMCHNNKMWPHRFSTLVLLMYNQIIDSVDYSCVNFELFNRDSIINLLGNSNFKKYLNYFNKLYNGGSKLSFFEEKLRFDEVNSDKIITKTFENSYVNIVTETDFEDDVLHITEKSLKPFYYFQYPLFVAPYGHIKKLKELYNFDFFEDLINHSYDNEPNHTKRLEMVIEQAKYIFTNKHLFIEKYLENKLRFEENQKKVIDIVNIDSDYLFIKNNLYGN